MPTGNSKPFVSTDTISMYVLPSGIGSLVRVTLYLLVSQHVVLVAAEVFGISGPVATGSPNAL